MRNRDFLRQTSAYFDEEKEKEEQNLRSLSLLGFEEKYSKNELITLKEFAKQKRMRVKNAEASEEWKKLIEDLRNFK